MKQHKFTLENREISWLSFNARVLQEAADERLPLFERLSFLAIYSSNLDEFFRVRVASMRSLMRLKRKSIDKLEVSPARLVKDITTIVTRQQDQFGAILRGQILPALRREGIVLLNEREVESNQADYLRAYFAESVLPSLQPASLDEVGKGVYVRDKGIYLVTEIWDVNADEPEYMLLEIPADIPRFVVLPQTEGQHSIIFLDDVIRYNLDVVYKGMEVGASYSIKLSRDADLYLEEEFADNMVAMIKKSLKKRETGVPSRLLYDLTTPFALAVKVKKSLDLKNEDMVQGGRYHNLNDFFAFPQFDKAHLMNEPMPPQNHPVLSNASSIFDAIAGEDQLLHVPYQSYDPVLRFFDEAADDEQVEEICISLYRVARDSSITKALIRAKEHGKQVTVFVEVKARFDEASNVYWTEQMEQAGIEVIYSIKGMEHFKVHAKIALIKRREDGVLRYYTYLGTGNFNEKTARLYVDEALLTADQRLGVEVERVFQFLVNQEEPTFEHLIVAPFTMRSAFNALIDYEIEEANAGRPAWIFAKMNSLEDEKMIRRLYKASNAGVKVRLIIRGICRLIPGIPDQSENIEIISIVDRFLEHARVYMFHHGGDLEMYLASADWMSRNLNRRVEVAFPIYHEKHRDVIQSMMEIQWSDNQKARRVDARQANEYVRNDGPPVRAQYALYAMYGEAKPLPELLPGTGDGEREAVDLDVDEQR